MQKEVVSFIEYLSPTPSEIAVREWLYQSVRDAVQTLFPSARVRIFGSFSTQLFIPSRYRRFEPGLIPSDVDITVFTPEVSTVEVGKALWQICNVIKRRMTLNHCEVRANAKVI